MTILEELRIKEEVAPNTFAITKLAEETIYHWSKQLNCSEDEAVDVLIRYMGLTENINKFLDDIKQKFKIEAWI